MTPQPTEETPPRHPSEPDLVVSTLLLDAVIALTAYRRELSRACYPFKEPPNVELTIRAIEEFCAPPDLRTIIGKSGKRGKK